MPHKVEGEWAWGNLREKDINKLRRKVWWIWHRAGEEGDFGTFWETGKTGPAMKECCEKSKSNFEKLYEKIMKETIPAGAMSVGTVFPASIPGGMPGEYFGEPSGFSPVKAKKEKVKDGEEEEASQASAPVMLVMRPAPASSDI